MTILGIDPGIARTGWAIVHQKSKSVIKSVKYGCIETHKDTPEELRLVHLYTQITKLIATYSPGCVTVEKLFFASNQKTATTVGQARGVIVLAAGIHKLPVYSYTPLQVKQAITGYGRAEKMQIQRMVQSILKLSYIPKPDDTADALAVAITHCYTQRFG
jgi:crossover junction endodeoxyribonuclease RuvC